MKDNTGPLSRSGSISAGDQALNALGTCLQAAAQYRVSARALAAFVDGLAAPGLCDSAVLLRCKRSDDDFECSYTVAGETDDQSSAAAGEVRCAICALVREWHAALVDRYEPVELATDRLAPWQRSALATRGITALCLYPLRFADSWYGVLGFMFRGAAEDASAVRLAGMQAAAGAAALLVEIEQLSRQLLQAQKMGVVGAFSSGIAHDFNNVLANIGSCAQLMLLDRPEDDEDYEDLRDIVHEVGRGAGLARQVLAFARPASDTDAAAVDVGFCVRRLGALLHRVLPADIEVQLDLHEDCLAAQIAAIELQQIVLNLAMNARNAMPDGGRLTIATRRVNDDAALGTAAELVVSDTGCGIPEELLDRIFDPFFTTRADAEGTGLGLAIVRDIVTRRGGTLSVQSRVGQGTAVRVLLPECHLTVGVPEESELPPNGDETVLIVEKDPVSRRALTRALERHGYHVLAAPDPALAMQMAGTCNGRVDLLLVGARSCAVRNPAWVELEAALVPLKMLLLSSGGEEASSDDSLPPGVRKLAKPADLSTILHEVRALLDHSP